MSALARILIGAGLLLLVAGGLVLLLDKAGLPPGRLPGDISYKGRHVSVYFPLGTCILLSVLLTAIFYLLSRFHK